MAEALNTVAPVAPKIPYGRADFRGIRLDGSLNVDKTRFVTRVHRLLAAMNQSQDGLVARRRSHGGRACGLRLRQRGTSHAVLTNTVGQHMTVPMPKPIKPVYIRAGKVDRGSVVRFEDYAIRVDPLPDDEGGGFLVTVPDLPGCMADGETVALAVAEARDAYEAWTTAEREDKGELPTPKTYSGQFVQRIPKSLHQRLARRAATEGVSLNQLAAMFLAQGLAGGK